MLAPGWQVQSVREGQLQHKPVGSWSRSPAFSRQRSMMLLFFMPSPFYTVEIPAHGIVPPTVRVVLPSQINFSRYILIGIHRRVSTVTLSSVNLTTKAKHHKPLIIAKKGKHEGHLYIYFRSLLNDSQSFFVWQLEKDTKETIYTAFYRHHGVII